MQPNKKLKQNQRVLVLWIDSQSEGGWVSRRRDDVLTDPTPIISTGFVRLVSSKFLTLAGSVSDTATLDHLSIPWAAIQKVKVCRED